MIAHDISNQLFEITDEICEQNVQTYVHYLDELNINLDYILIDKLVAENLKVDIRQRCIWYPDLEDIGQICYDMGIIDAQEYDDILMYSRFGIKPD